jgi:hypothetical protein
MKRKNCLAIALAGMIAIGRLPMASGGYTYVDRPTPRIDWLIGSGEEKLGAQGAHWEFSGKAGALPFAFGGGGAAPSGIAALRAALEGPAGHGGRDLISMALKGGAFTYIAGHAARAAKGMPANRAPSSGAGVSFRPALPEGRNAGSENAALQSAQGDFAASGALPAPKAPAVQAAAFGGIKSTLHMSARRTRPRQRAGMAARRRAQERNIA